MRVLLDANVLVSARIKTRGEAGKILNQAAEQFDLLLPDFLLRKVEEVLQRPHIQRKYTDITEEAITHYLTALRVTGFPVVGQTTIEPSATTSRDTEDLLVLAAAVDGKADYLVTYNVSHFPEIYQNTTILLPKSFGQVLSPPE